MTSPQTANGPIRVAMVGLRFGAEFVPIHLNHPDVASVAICDSDPDVLRQMGEKFGIDRRFERLEDVCAAGDIDAVHLVTPIPVHAAQTIAVLESGKHCACTVPMATSIEDLRAILAAKRTSGKKYMMMETAVYTRQFLYVKDLLARGEFGRVQLLRGAHYQDMEGWPPYWRGLPPMHYATHAVSPCLAVAGTRSESVHCFGSGVMGEELQTVYGNPYPIETAIFRLHDSPIAMEITRALFRSARQYTESFNVYGEWLCFEWQQIEKEESPVLFRVGEFEAGRGRPSAAERIDVPDRGDLLPAEIARFTRRGVYDQQHAHLSFLFGGGHGGSHPHLVNEFVRSIVENREPFPGAIAGADWTAAGICAHASAMAGGRRVAVPAFD